MVSVEGEADGWEDGAVSAGGGLAVVVMGMEVGVQVLWSGKGEKKYLPDNRGSRGVSGGERRRIRRGLRISMADQSSSGKKKFGLSRVREPLMDESKHVRGREATTAHSVIAGITIRFRSMFAP